MRVVVAGATGYLGGHLLDVLCDAGVEVVALARSEAKLGERATRCARVHVADATRSEELEGLCVGASALFSSVGIRTFARRPSLWDVDYAANLNLVERAKAEGVEHVVFTSVLHGDRLRSVVEVAEARERIVDWLRQSGLRHTILRPTGFFNDMRDYFDMARRGTAWVIGDGHSKLNPIHGVDLATRAAAAILDRSGASAELELGGPDTFTNRQIAELAFEVLGAPPKVSGLPGWVLRASSTVIRPFNRNASSFIRALAAFGELDFVGEPTGDHHLREFFESLAS